jgi:aminodeoxyfutalosine deaminase
MTTHRAPWVVPIDAPPIRDGVVELDARGTVISVGGAQSLGGRDVIEHRGVLMPGLVNAHTHVELSHLAGRVPGGDGLVRWIRRLLSARALTPESERAIHSAAASLVERGTVAVADIANTGAPAPILRAHGLEVIDFDEKIAPLGPPAPTRRAAVPVPHATYTCGADALTALAAATYGRIASIHIDEDPAEAMFLVEGAGPFAELLAERGKSPISPPPRRRPVHWLDALGVLGPGTLLVHLTFSDDESLRIAAARGATAVLCPRSNRHITGRLPPVSRMRAAGLPIALGTDSLASSPSLDVLAEVTELARSGCEPAWALGCATLGGARALDRPWLGALTPGRAPGLLSFGDHAHTLTDPIGWLAFEGHQAPVARLAPAARSTVLA